MPRRGAPVQHVPAEVRLPCLFCCLLIDRVAAVRSVDSAAEEGVVAPPGGAPGTPAGYCWLLDVSLRRVARSGWTFSDHADHDDLGDVQAHRSRSYVPFLPFSFFVLVQKDDGVMVVPPPGGAGVGGGGGDREWMYERWLQCLSPRTSSLLLNIRTPGQKLRLGGDALGADPTYLLYLPSRSYGGI